MTSLPILMMAGLVAAAVAVAFRSPLGALRSLSVPVSVGFFYTAVLQAWDSAKNPPADLSMSDIGFAVQIAIVAFISFLTGYSLRQRPAGAVTAERINFERLKLSALAVSLAGAAGFGAVVVTAGGPAAYFGRGYWQANVFQELSGYVYALKYFLQVGMALAVIARAHRQLGSWADLLLIAGFALFGLEAIKFGERGGLIRISALFCAWVMLRPASSNTAQDTSLWRWLIAGMAGLIVSLGVLVFPYIRGPARNVFDSETRISEAARTVADQHAASRFGAKQGGEFDYAARIAVGVREGIFSHPGPAPLLRFFWNLIPRHLLPEKHEIFARFVGDRYYVMTNLRSYDGCAPTGWGESYGLMGWWGVIGYWLVLGLGVKRLEASIQDRAAGLAAAMVFFLPLTQFVVMECWQGLMNVFYVVIPFLAALWFSTRSTVLFAERVGHAARIGQTPGTAERSRRSRGRQRGHAHVR